MQVSLVTRDMGFPWRLCTAQCGCWASSARSSARAVSPFGTEPALQSPRALFKCDLPATHAEISLPWLDWEVYKKRRQDYLIILSAEGFV